MKQVTNANASEHGFTLVEALIASAILSIGVVLASHTVVAIANSRAQINSAKSYTEVDGDLKAAVWTTFKNQYVSAASCNVGAFAPSMDAMPIGSYGVARLERQADSSASTALADALHRCNQPPVVANATGFYYLCYAVKPTVDRDKLGSDAFLRSQTILAEVQIQLVSLATGTPVACETFNTTRTAGARVIVAFHWLRQQPQGGSEYHANVSALLAGR